jgi:DNA-directed RNA polymerase subunit RPC12/RpoP
LFFSVFGCLDYLYRVYQPESGVRWCINCRREFKEGEYRRQANGVIDCPRCRDGKLTKHKEKIFRPIPQVQKRPPKIDPRYLKPVQPTNNHKVKLAAGVVAFDDEPALIERMMDSLVDFDHVIVCEGKYDVNPFGFDHSTNGTLEVFYKYPNVTILDCAGMRQSDVRNMYIQEAIKLGCDHLLVIECDEYITGDMQEFRDSLPTHGLSGPDKTVYTTFMRYVEPNIVTKSPRFMYGLEHFRYGNTHSTYIIDGVKWFARNGNTIQCDNLPGILVNHDEAPRTKEQQDKALYYQIKLASQEKQEREELKAEGRYL